MKGFEWLEPKKIQEACQALFDFKTRARAYAGGTDVLVEMKTGRSQPQVLVNLKHLRGLETLRYDDRKGLRVGALVTWTQLLDSEAVVRHYPLLHQAAATMGSVQVRNVATLAGNICHASPAANGPVPLLVYEARCRIQGPSGRREIPVEKLFAGVQKNSLKAGELLTEIVIPPPPEKASGVFYKFAQRKAMELPIVAVGALIRTAADGSVDLARIALGAVAPKPFRALRAEKALLGQNISEALLRSVAETALEESDPITDIRASKDYRRELIRELVYRAVQESLAAQPARV
jgi:carbon-monoxide dehydrogenase medium subunit